MGAFAGPPGQGRPGAGAVPCGWDGSRSDRAPASRLKNTLAGHDVHIELFLRRESIGRGSAAAMAAGCQRTAYDRGTIRAIAYSVPSPSPCLAARPQAHPPRPPSLPPVHTLAGVLASALVTGLIAAAPSVAANVACTGTVTNTNPFTTSFSCSGPSPVRAPGTGFTIDFSDIIEPGNGGSFSTAFSPSRQLQIRIAASGGSAGGNISFSDVALSLKKTGNAAQNGRPWQSDPDAGSSGVLSYVESDPAPPFWRLASFTLASDASDGAILLNLPLQFNQYLNDAGISNASQFDSLQLTGTFLGLSSLQTTQVAFQLVTSDFSPTLGGNPLTFGTVLDFAEVPAPLPAVGAVAAFGWSRRLRQRIRQGATARR